ncbi:lipoprotein [Streptomyces sp. NPDC013953]|uniref:lipoprotein n=1 Tax=Streptomyces sp. NPDC013953 TaxID=3364868 RepID=UPI0036FF5B1A
MGRYGVRGVVPVVAAGLLLAGCSAGSDAPGKAASGTPSAAAPSASASSGTAAKGERLGAAGSPCPMPVTFDAARQWTAKKVTAAEDPDLAELAQQGPVTLVCEVDAKPAGHIGFLRVWTGARKAGTAREALEAFVSAEENVYKARYHDTKAGALAATEVTYMVVSELDGEQKDERAFAVTTPAGPVVVHLGGLDSAEHRAMLPAYELARASLALAG